MSIFDLTKKNSEQFQQERDRLLAEVESLNADGQTHKLRDAQLQKLKSLEAQVTSIS
jgi:kinesin family protein 4/21/27